MTERTSRAKVGACSFLATLWLATVLTPGAAGHTSLERAVPADASSLAAGPRQLQLWFSGGVDARLSSATLVDARGRSVPLSLTSAGPRSLVARVPSIGRGAYAVDWRVLSGEDAHVLRGSLVFAVGAGVPVPAGGGQAWASLPAPGALLRWLDLLALAVVAGAFSASWLLDSAAARGRALRLGLAGGVAMVVLGVGTLAAKALAAPAALSPRERIAAALQLLAETRWGSLWLVYEGVALLVCLWFVLALRRRTRRVDGRSPRTSAAAATLAGTLVTAQALTSHAVGLPSARPQAVAAATVHLVAAAVWAGGLLVLVASLWPLRTGGRLTEEARAAIRRFAPVAAGAFAVLVVTGLYSASREVASVDALLQTLYGRTLLAKLVLVLAVALLVAAAARHVTRSQPPRGAGRPLLLVDAGAAALVLLAAAVLATSPPARGPEFVRAAMPSSVATRQVDDLLLTISVQPNRPGPNVVTVRTASMRRPDRVPLDRVTVKPEGRRPLVARTVAPGIFRTAAILHELPSLTVAVERRGVPDAVARLRWTLAPALGTRPVTVSDRPLRPLLFAASAFAALVFAAVAAGLALPGWRAAAAQLALAGAAAPTGLGEERR